MQILKTGSFLNLENAESVEALKSTARLLAEHSMGAVKENLTAQQLEGLANNLWRKAEYLTRETERRRLQQIFIENFTERFRELKPELIISTTENADSVDQFSVAEQLTDTQTETENQVLATEDSSEKTEKTDEFLGFVKSDESFGNAPEAEEKAVKVEEFAREVDFCESEKIVETAKIENQAVDRASEQVEKSKKDVAEKTEAAKTQTTAKNDTSATDSINKTSADAKEPFEFGKCTVSLNLTLLASDTDKSRKAIVSIVSHNLPAEIELLEIADGEDLEQITELVKNKLVRFRQSLPVKYIEQLRATKNKPAKRNEPTKPTVPVTPTQSEEKQPETSPEKVQTAVSNPPLPSVNQQNTANAIQGSLF